MFFYHGLILLIIFMLPIVGLLVYGLAKLFSKSDKKQRTLLTFVIILCASFAVGWFLPIGTLTGGAWQLSSGFSANPRHIRPAPLSIQFFDDGTGIKIDYEGYERDFEWHITMFDEVAISTRWSSYIVRFHGFGTRLSLEDSMRGERSMGRFDTRRDFTAHFRRSFLN